MWNDIRNRADELAKNKVVASLISGKTEWADDDLYISPLDLDNNVASCAVWLCATETAFFSSFNSDSNEPLVSGVQAVSSHTPRADVVTSPNSIPAAVSLSRVSCHDE